MECIIVNDGSTDGTSEICKSFITKDTRFRFIDKENTGVSDSRNIGIVEAAGKYVFFLDADDYINIDHWPKIMEKADRSEFDMIAYGHYSLFDSGGVQAELFPEGTDIKYAVLSTTLLNSCWAKLLRKKIITENNLAFRKGLKTCEDAVFVLEFVRNAKNIMLSNSCVIYYRVNDAGVMRQTSPDNKLADFAQLFALRKEYLEDHYDENLKMATYKQFFSVITDLLRTCTAGRRLSQIRCNFKNCLKNETIRAIMRTTNIKYLSPVYKKFEFLLIRHELYMILAVYFKIKARLTALKVRRLA